MRQQLSMVTGNVGNLGYYNCYESRPGLKGRHVDMTEATIAAAFKKGDQFVGLDGKTYVVSGDGAPDKVSGRLLGANGPIGRSVDFRPSSVTRVAALH
jgi:hypothetical protein